MDFLSPIIDDKGGGGDVLFEAGYFLAFAVELGGEGRELGAPAGEPVFEDTHLLPQGEGAFFPSAELDEPGREKQVTLRGDKIQGGVPKPDLDGRPDISNDDCVAELSDKILDLRAGPEARFQVPENVEVGDVRRWGVLSLFVREKAKAALERPLCDSSQEIQRWDNGQAGFLLPEGVDERRVIGLCFDEVGQAAKGLRDVFAGRWPADPPLHFFQGIEPVAVLFPRPPGLFDPLLEAGEGGAPFFQESPKLPALPFLFFFFG